MIEKNLMRLTFILCKYLFKKHGKDLLMIHGTGKHVGKQLIYSEIPIITQGLMKILEIPINESEVK